MCVIKFYVELKFIEGEPTPLTLIVYLFTCYVSYFNFLTVTSSQSAQESTEVQDELSEKVDRLKAELVVFKSLMTDVSICSVLG